MSKPSSAEEKVSTSCYEALRKNWIAIAIVSILIILGAIFSPMSSTARAKNDYLVTATAEQTGNGTGSLRASIMHGIKNKTRVERKFDLEMNAKRRILTAKSEIYQFWDIRNFPRFLETMHIPEDTWLTYKYKFVDLLMNSKDNNETAFVIGFSGSSVTAGHDNFFNESYPAVVERTLEPVFKELGIKLKVRNAAMGNNPCYPYDACLANHVGIDADIVTWEQSLNCGRDSKPVESFIRASGRMKKRPMVVFMTSGTPFWSEADCPDSQSRFSSPNGQLSRLSPFALAHNEHYNRTTPMSNEEKELLRKPLSFVANHTDLNDAMPFLTVEEGRKYEGRSLAKYYENQVAISFQHVSTVVSAYKCQGPYGPDFGSKTMGKGKDWHPGVMGHKYRADSFSYFMLEILKEAVTEVSLAQMRGRTSMQKIHEEAHQHLNTHLFRSNLTSSKLQDQHHTSIPRPLSCNRAVCDKDPVCFTDFQPNEFRQLSSMVVGGKSPPPGWSKELSWFDVNGVAKAQSQGRGYKDLKYILISAQTGDGPSEGGELTFEINTQSNNSVWLCQVQRGFGKYTVEKGVLNEAAEVAITLNVKKSIKRSDEFTGARSGKRLNLTPSEDECFKTDQVPPGRHFLSIWPKVKSVQVNIAYLLTW